MLQSMRELAHSWVFKGLMIILVASFGIWGIGDMFRGNPLHRTVATVGSTTINVQELNRAFEQSLARARQMFSPDLTAQQAKQMGLADNTLNDLIENSLVDQDRKRLGIQANDRTVFQVLMQDPQLKDKDGHFDKSILQNYLTQQRISERDFLDQQRKELANRQLFSAIATLPPAPQTMIDALYKARGQKRILDVITLDNNAVSNAATADDKTLQDFYQQNPKPFTSPETRSLTIAVLTTDSIAKDITISDDQVKKEYDSKGDQLAEPEKRDVLQVVVQEEDKAKALVNAAKASGNLVGAAKPTGHEVMPMNGTEEASLLPDIAKPVFALKQGGVTDPIKSPLGWHVLQVRKITPAGLPKYEDIKEKLRASMKNDQAADTASRLVNQMDDKLAAGHSLDDMAEAMKLRLIKIPAVDANGKTPEGKDPAELPHKDDVLKAAFAQNSGETSPVMDDRNGNYYVVRTENVTPSALKPFDKVKTEVITAWKKQEMTKLAAAEAESIAKALREGKAASSFATRKGVDVRVSKPISLLGDSDPALPKSALPDVLKLKKGEVVVIPNNDKQLIVRLLSLVPVAEAADDATAGKINSEINTDMPKELADEYVRYLRVLFPVTIKQDAFDSLAQQGG